MLPFAYYLLKVIICSGVLFGYYWFLLRNKLFHGYNRFYLLAIVVLSLALPLMKINIWQKASEPPTNVVKMLQVVSSSDEYMDEVIIYSQRNHINKEQIISFLFIAVCAVFFFMLLRALYRIRALLKNNSATLIENIYFVKTTAKGTPFSFLRFIFWNDAIDTETRAGKQIFKHEVAHVQEKHSYDKLFINSIMIVFWCNPFFWLIRKELNMIHEFVADQKAIEDGDTADFAAMILQATYPQHSFQLANNFFYSPIKRRLTMLTKQHKTTAGYISRLLVLPLAVMVFAAFTFKTKTYFDNNFIQGKTITVMIDAGHGGTDNGATGANNIYEKDITLLLAKRIKELNKSNNIRIILTRETDIYQSPQQKVAIAKEANADLFISIHLDGAPKNAKDMRTGMSVYVAKDQYENSEASKLLASAVISGFQKNYGLNVGANPEQRQLGIWVLQANICPSVLIEAGCINNPSDLAYLKTDKAIETFASNLLKAIENYSSTKTAGPVNNKTSFDLSVDVKNTDSAYLKSETIKSKALVIVDSKEVGNLGYNYVEKNLALYSKITVYDPPKAISLYGEKGKYGVLQLTTRQETEKPTPQTITAPDKKDNYISADQIIVNDADGTTFTGDIKVKLDKLADTRLLVILNGKEALDEAFKKIDWKLVDFVRLLSPETAVKTYGEKGKNGVMIINARKEGVFGDADKLIIIDGTLYEVSFQTALIQAGENRDIESMTLLNKEEAIKKYGNKGEKGAVEIITKAKSSPSPDQNLSITLSGIAGPKIAVSELKNIKEISSTNPTYHITHATIYFSGTGFTNVVSVDISNSSLKNISYFDKIVPGSVVSFDNVMAESNDGRQTEVNGKSFSFYDITKDDIIFSKVENEPEFPGGKDGWRDFLVKNLNAGMPVDEGWKAGTYRIVVQFIVDVEGNVSDVKTTDHPGSKTAMQCVNLIKNGPKWIPAMQNGKKVKAYRKQPITFVVSDQ